MKSIREAIRLVKIQNLSRNKAASVLGIGKSTVKDYLSRFEKSGIEIQDVLSKSDSELLEKLFPQPIVEAVNTKPEPDMDEVIMALKHPCVTAKILWEEYIEKNPDGIRYTQFCERIKARQDSRPLSMRREHLPGKTVFVDYSGERPEYIDIETGEVRKAELLVMTWGTSNFTYAEAQESQKSVNWTMGHVRAFSYFGCTPHEITPDCLKGSVIKAHKYDPVLNQTYVDLCTHYSIAVLPARPLEPRDKGKVENAVKIAQYRILARLRNRTFRGLAELNTAIREYLEDLNDRPMEGYEGQNRRQLFESIDKPAAQTLPAEAWEHREWLVRHAGSDYCIEVDKHWYSVPYKYRCNAIDVKITEHTVQAYFENERIATHPRSTKKYAHSILEEHMPESHSHSRPVSIEQLLWRAKHIGLGMVKLCEYRISRSPHQVEALRPLQGLIRKAERLENPARADKAATYALAHGMTSCDGYQRVIDSRVAEREIEEDLGFVSHENLQGKALFQKEA